MYIHRLLTHTHTHSHTHTHTHTHTNATFVCPKNFDREDHIDNVTVASVVHSKKLTTNAVDGPGSSCFDAAGGTGAKPETHEARLEFSQRGHGGHEGERQKTEEFHTGPAPTEGITNAGILAIPLTHQQSGNGRDENKNDAGNKVDSNDHNNDRNDNNNDDDRRHNDINKNNDQDGAAIQPIGLKVRFSSSSSTLAAFADSSTKPTRDLSERGGRKEEEEEEKRRRSRPKSSSRFEEDFERAMSRMWRSEAEGERQ